jgi:hypothetical protein
LEKIPYHGIYPTAARYLIEEGITATPRQVAVELRWADGVNIIYTLRGLTPANFAKYSESLLLLAQQEAMRYNKVARWKFAFFSVKLGRLKKGRDLPDIIDFQAHMHDDPEIMVYGPGYDVPTKVFLKDQADKIIDVVKRYSDRLNKQTPFRVIKLTIAVREPRPYSGSRLKSENDEISHIRRQ